jgi:hypothetical protein
MRSIFQSFSAFDSNGTFPRSVSVPTDNNLSVVFSEGEIQGFAADGAFPWRTARLSTDPTDKGRNLHAE